VSEPALVNLSIREAALLLEQRKLSPLELTDACIERAEALEGRLNAYLTRTFEGARVEAKTAGEEIADGRYRGALHGIPFAFKDIYETAGVRTTAGSRLRDDYVPAEDARTVELLKQAGVVMLGKLNLHEWAMGGTNVNEYYPTPRNPWDITRITGGSSGGSAAAIAAGYCYGTLGTDTRGSIRIPAALCGISGLKPTYGRVSIRGIVPLNWSLDHSGPMARTAEDCAILLNCIAGLDDRDPTSADVPVPDYSASLASPVPGRNWLSNVRIGVPRNFFFDADVLDSQITEAIEVAKESLSELGADLVEIDFPEPLEFAASGAFFAEALAYHEARFQEQPELYGEAIRNRLTTNASISGVDYVRNRYQQLELQTEVRRLFRDVDLFLTPTSVIPAPTIDSVDVSASSPTLLGRNTSPFNILGIPTISVPCGLTSDGLPIGLQLSGRWWEEGLVLRAAHAYQQVTDWHKRFPPLEIATD
jgi:aspartyl-tRNA(Asn)/glutamyl-tRNA(Gln) amidotransferase subunit A